MAARDDVILIDLDVPPMEDPPYRWASILVTVVICAVMVLLGAGLVASSPTAAAVLEPVATPADGRPDPMRAVPGASHAAVRGAQASAIGPGGVYATDGDRVVLVSRRGLVVPLVDAGSR